MNISFFFFTFFFVLIFDETLAKSGGHGGRGGGGRGSSGARSSSFSRSRSSGGGKYHSSTSYSSYVHYDSSAFRSSVLEKSSPSGPYFTTSTSGHTYIINQPSTPIIYDNHHYYWHGHYHSGPTKRTVCEYAISDEDGWLMNVTYSNGTSPKALVFECGNWEKCCGMGCCNSVGDWIGFAIWFIFVIFVVTYICCKD
ncbi:unnamed protein product [Caenorhabditis sp. 36 PRJEB53466]|nr:unnamed protein product [Caenorhabditis sp. 36 PRJEB53466]